MYSKCTQTPDLDFVHCVYKFIKDDACDPCPECSPEHKEICKAAYMRQNKNIVETFKTLQGDVDEKKFNFFRNTSQGKE